MIPSAESEEVPLEQVQSSSTPSPVWTAKATDSSAVESLAARFGCPHAVAQILVAYGIDTLDAADAFLNPTLTALLDDPANDPAQLLGIGRAVERILSSESFNASATGRMRTPVFNNLATSRTQLDCGAGEP